MKLLILLICAQLTTAVYADVYDWPTGNFTEEFDKHPVGYSLIGAGGLLSGF